MKLDDIVNQIKKFFAPAPKSNEVKAPTPPTKPSPTEASATDTKKTEVIYKKDGRLYNPFDWVRHILLWSNGMIVCLFVLNLFIWGGWYIQTLRDYQVIDLQKPLILSAYESLDSEQDISKLDIKRQSNLILYALHNYSYAAGQDFEPISGIVSPDIISNAEVAYQSNFGKMRESAMVNSIYISDYPLIGRQSKNGKIDVIVKGYLLVLTQANNSAGLPARTIPYRAELTYLVRPATHLTGRKTLYLSAITEVAGTREAAIFDDALKSKIHLMR